jgi:FkbM family methyltransferase
MRTLRRLGRSIANPLRSLLGLNGLSDRLDAMASELQTIGPEVRALRPAMNTLLDANPGFVTASLPDGKTYELSIDPRRDRDNYHESVSISAMQDPTWSFLMAWLRPADVFFDLGANIGTISIPAALRCTSVHAFEMLAENVVHLRRALERNKIGNVAVVQAAVSDRPGLIGAGGSSAWGSVVAKATLSVPTVVVDDYVRLRGIDRVDVMKIDIEGSELRALTGAAQLIARDHPDIVLESNSVTCGANRFSYRDLLRRVREFGYATYRIQGNRLCPWPDDAVQEVVYADYLATVKDPAIVAMRSGRELVGMTDQETVESILSAAQYDQFWRQHVLAVADRLPRAAMADPRAQAALREWAPLASGPAFEALRVGTA